MLHVAYIDVDPTDVVERAARGFDRGLDILADLLRLLGDVADPAMLPSGRRAVIPEMKTKRPVASIAVAWENTPFGWRSFGLKICVLGIGTSSSLERGCRNAKLGSEAVQHGGDGRIERHHAVGASAPPPFGLAGRQQLRRRPARAGRADLPRPPPLPAPKIGSRPEMRNVDGDEEMRAVIWYGKIAIQGTYLPRRWRRRITRPHIRSIINASPKPLAPPEGAACRR